MNVMSHGPGAPDRVSRADRLARIRAVLLSFTLLVGLAVAPSVARADESLRRGPDPTASALAAEGPFAVSTSRVSLASGFGGGTIYYPNDTSQGTFATVAISPGYLGSESTVAWLGRRIASHGFVAITISTYLLTDLPSSRGRQLLAALDYVATSSPAAVQQRVDPSRRAVVGHSMGGGGVLEAADGDEALRAGVALTPWHTSTRWSSLSTPVLVVGAQNDITAAVNRYAIPIYNGLSAPKAYVELARASHLAPTRSDATISRMTIAWLKRYVDDDTRYTQLLVPGPGGDPAVSDWRSAGLS